MPTVYVTAPRDAAPDLARRIVENRLAACVNIVECASIYRWEGEVHEDDEVVLFVKTTEGAYEDCVDAITSGHPYDVPCIERFDETAVMDSFARWREAAVRS